MEENKPHISGKEIMEDFIRTGGIREKEYLITTDNWFYAPDGKKYKAVWGKVEILEDKFLGVTTNRNSSNWFAKVGTENNHVIVAGCQIHYAVRCGTPNTDNIKESLPDNGKYILSERETEIYIAE